MRSRENILVCLRTHENATQHSTPPAERLLAKAKLQHNGAQHLTLGGFLDNSRWSPVRRRPFPPAPPPILEYISVRLFSSRLYSAASILVQIPVVGFRRFFPSHAFDDGRKRCHCLLLLLLACVHACCFARMIAAFCLQLVCSVQKVQIIVWAHFTGRSHSELKKNVAQEESIAL